MRPEAQRFFSTLEIVMKYVGIFMAIIYVTAGVSILFRSRELFSIPKPYIVPLGLGLTAYGVFRGFRLYLRYFKKRR